MDTLEKNPEIKEVFRIKIENISRGNILVSTNQGKQWQNIGTVIKPVTMTNKNGFSASRFGEIGTVCAVAVNALHIKADINHQQDTGIIFSILPKNVDMKNQSYFHSPSSILTTLKPQEGFFGGNWTPFVGNSVHLEDAAGKLMPLPINYIPQQGDRLVILVLRPVPFPKEIIFENFFGGKVSIIYPNGSKKEIAKVLQPVQGVGRFIGTQYSGLSRVRANHSGVIDISTSLGQGKVGGFQIVPAIHAMDSEMQKTRTMTQWMVIGPLDSEVSILDGSSPLFSYYIQPIYAHVDISQKDWKKRLTERTLVQVQIGNSKKWQTIPSFNFDPDKPLPESAHTALQNISAIKIIFPQIMYN